MVINTRDFGEREIKEQEIITFARGIYGFTGMTKFVRLTDAEIGEGIIWLQSLEDAALCFVLIDVKGLGLEYTPELSEEAKVLLNLNDKEKPTYYAIATFKENIQESYMNLKSPIVLNEANKLALQEIVEEDFPLRFPLYGSEE